MREHCQEFVLAAVGDQEFLDLSRRDPCRMLPSRDVANVALDDLVVVFIISVADDFYVDAIGVSRALEEQVLMADEPGLTKLVPGRAASLGVPQQASQSSFPSSSS